VHDDGIARSARGEEEVSSRVISPFPPSVSFRQVSRGSNSNGPFRRCPAASPFVSSFDSFIAFAPRARAVPQEGGVGSSIGYRTDGELMPRVLRIKRTAHSERAPRKREKDVPLRPHAALAHSVLSRKRIFPLVKIRPDDRSAKYPRFRRRSSDIISCRFLHLSLPRLASHRAIVARCRVRILRNACFSLGIMRSSAIHGHSQAVPLCASRIIHRVNLIPRCIQM